MNIEEKIDNAIIWAEQEMTQPSAYGYLPDIIAELKDIKNNLNNCEKYRLYASGLGRLVTEDYDFSESELGTLLCEIADYFLPPAEDVWK